MTASFLIIGYFSAVLASMSFSNRPAITCFALPTWGAAFEVRRRTDHDHGDHAHAVVGQALDAVDAGLVEGHCDVLTVLAHEWGRIGRQHALDGFGVVTLVGGDKFDGVAGGDFYQRRFEHHQAFGALVEHVDLDLGGA